ncbi:MAG: hypothetical protein SCH70_07115 [Candidatus Methanoperedens sp.]|nr:hypothetical protein [Candidatus Methanoperedens sp.]
MKMKPCPRYAWAGNRIRDKDMAAMYRMKRQTSKPITQLAADAVSLYVSQYVDVKADEVG